MSPGFSAYVPSPTHTTITSMALASDKISAMSTPLKSELVNDGPRASNLTCNAIITSVKTRLTVYVHCC
jgi:hypothetical protein